MPCWKLTLFGGFQLVDPYGVIVPITMRKAQGLIAILATSADRSLDRVSLQEALWPEFPVVSQQASLRQALAHLRKVLPHEFVIASRTVCRIAPDIRLSSDVFETDPESNAVFLPEFPEPWFERQRRKFRFATGELDSPALEQGGSIVDSVLTLLRWYANSDPSKTLTLLRDHAEIVEGIAPKELLPIVQAGLTATDRSSGLYGWGLHWKGVCLGAMQNIADGEPYMMAAIQFGIERQDAELLTRSSCTLACGYALLGRAAGAARTMERVQGLAGGRSPNAAMVSTARGALMHHAGNAVEGIRLIQLAGDTAGVSAPEWNRIQALLAVFLSSDMRNREALEALRNIEGIGLQSNDSHISLLTLLAQGQTYLNEGAPEMAVKVLADLARRASRCLSLHLELYARESHALASWRMGDGESARRELRAANRLRQSLGLGFTPWDTGRLSELSRPAGT